MKNKFGVKSLALIFSIVASTAACAADAESAMKLQKPGPGQVSSTGAGLQSLLNELAQLGIDPNRLSTMDANGQVVTPFTPGVTVRWQRISSVSTGTSTGLRPNDVASGTGKPGDIEIDTVRNGTTITIFTWQYQQLAGGGYAWVAVGVVSYTVQAGTHQK